MMNALDEYDVRASFTALDTDIEGSLCLQDFYTLYLATGFTPVRIPISNLQQEVQAIAGGPVDRISLDLCLEVLSQHTRNPRQDELEIQFQLVDEGNKGYLTADDVRQLSSTASSSGQAGISQQQAERMVAFVSNNKDQVVHRNDFEKLMSPPSP